MALRNTIDCPKFEDCSAPICPFLQSTLDGGIWYPDEEICKAKKFWGLDWIKKQKAISKARAPNDRYFTVEMIKAINRVQKGIAGIDPDQPLEEAEKAERNWILMFQKRAKLQSYKPKKQRNSVANKRAKLVVATATSNQDRGGAI